MGFLNEPEQSIGLASQGFGQDAGDKKKPYSISLREGYRPEVRDISEKRASPENNPLLSCWPRFS